MSDGSGENPLQQAWEAAASLKAERDEAAALLREARRSTWPAGLFDKITDFLARIDSAKETK